MWDTKAHYVPPSLGSRLISIKAQPSVLQRVLKRSEYKGTKMCLQQSFFIIHDAEYTALTTLLIETATEMSLGHMVLWLRQDQRFSQGICHMVRSL